MAAQRRDFRTRSSYSSAVRAAGSLLILVLCGVGYGLCFPPIAAKALAWVVLVPALVVLRRAPPARAALGAAVLAMAGACATVVWLPRTVVIYFQQPLAIGIALFVGVTLAMVAPYYAGFALFYGRAARRPRAVLPLLAGAAWVAGELGRSHLLGGNPWVLFGYTQVGMQRVAQLADLTGVYGLSFVLAAANVALAEAWLAWRAGRRLGRATGAGLLLTGALIVAVLGYGQWRLARPPVPAGAAVPVALVQGNVDLGAQWRSELYGQTLELYLRMTLDTLRAERARLVIWPETAMTFFVADEPAYRASIASVLRPFDAELLAGGPYVVGGDHPRFYNAAFLIAPDGAVQGRYDKRRLLPFAEAVPLAGLDLIRRNFGRVREFTPGAPRPLLPTAAGPAGVLICNEALYPDDARERTLAGAQILVNLSNDTWMDSIQFSTIAFDMSALRAVEQRRYLIRVSTAGPSAIVDPLGRTVVRDGLFTRGVLRGSVAPLSAATLYARAGDVFAYACVGVTALACGVWALRRRAA